VERSALMRDGSSPALGSQRFPPLGAKTKLLVLWLAEPSRERGAMGARRREKAWSDFAAWCKTRGLQALPAHPWTVAAYARWCETRYRYPIIVMRIRAIARAHVLACATSPDRHPTVTRTLRTIEARGRTRASRAALFPADEVGRAAAAVVKPPRRSLRERRRERSLRASPRLVSRRPR
jgi:hypothetical protein